MKDRDVLIVGDIAGVEARVLALLAGTGVTLYFDEVVPASVNSGRDFRLTPLYALYGGLDIPDYKSVDDEPVPLSQRKGGGLVHGPVQKRGKGKYRKFS